MATSSVLLGGPPHSSGTSRLLLGSAPSESASPSPLLMGTMRPESFSPASISGLAAWWKADGTLYQDSARTTLATADGDPVGSWTDESGNGKHALQATSNKRAILKLAIINGRQIVRFDGTDDVLATASVPSTATDNFTLVAVVKPAAFTTSRAPLSMGANSGTGVATATNTGKKGMIRGGIAWDASTTNNDLALGLYILERAAGTATLYVDGTALSPTWSGAPNTPATGATLGAHDVSGSEYWNGDFCEGMIYAAALTSTDRANLRSYAQSRWGTP